jgi:long-subunit acyl-CoA synthetase (AMP-forming)
VARASGIAILELATTPENEAGVFALDVAQLPAGSFNTDPDDADDLALVLHTSGTTGTPKLVPLTHANILAAMNRVQRALELSSHDRLLNVTALFHAQGVMLTLTSILSGGSVVCTPGFRAAQFFDWLEEFRPTWYSAAPAVHRPSWPTLRAGRESPITFDCVSSGRLAPSSHPASGNNWKSCSTRP